MQRSGSLVLIDIMDVGEQRVVLEKLLSPREDLALAPLPGRARNQALAGNPLAVAIEHQQAIDALSKVTAGANVAAAQKTVAQLKENAAKANS